MKRSRNYFLLAFALLAITFSSCKKDEEEGDTIITVNYPPTTMDLLTKSNWILESSETIVLGEGESNNIPFCAMDDVLSFDTEFNYGVDTGDSLCNIFTPAIPVLGEWYLSENEQNLITYSGNTEIIYEIRGLSETTLKLKTLPSSVVEIRNFTAQ